MMVILHNWLGNMLKVGDPALGVLTALVACASLLILAFLAGLFARQVLLKIVTRLIENSKNDWDDLFLFFILPEMIAK